MARFILETDDPSRRIIRLRGHPSKCKHMMNFPDELCKCSGREVCLAGVSDSLYYDLIVRFVQHLYTQTDQPSGRTTKESSSEQTKYADRMIRLDGSSVYLSSFIRRRIMRRTISFLPKFVQMDHPSLE